MSAIGSNAPVLMSPACAQTIVGPSCSASAVSSSAGAMRPWSSVGTRQTRSAPSPSMRQATGTVTCACSLAITRNAGPPWRPCASTSQPGSRSTAWRAAARQVKCAIWQPVTKPTPQALGRPSRSRIQPATTSSATDRAGDAAYPPPFWSQADVSQSAATELLDDGAGIFPVIAQRPGELGPELGEVGRCTDRAGRKALDVGVREAGGFVENFVARIDSLTVAPGPLLLGWRLDLELEVFLPDPDLVALLEPGDPERSEEHTSELQSHSDLV